MNRADLQESCGAAELDKVEPQIATMPAKLAEGMAEEPEELQERRAELRDMPDHAEESLAGLPNGRDVPA